MTTKPASRKDWSGAILNATSFLLWSRSCVNLYLCKVKLWERDCGATSWNRKTSKIAQYRFHEVAPTSVLLRENEKSPTWRKFNTLISVITKTTDLEPQHFGKRKILTNFARKSKKKKNFFFCILHYGMAQCYFVASLTIYSHMWKSSDVLYW